MGVIRFIVVIGETIMKFIAISKFDNSIHIFESANNQDAIDYMYDVFGQWRELYKLFSLGKQVN